MPEFSRLKIRSQVISPGTRCALLVLLSTGVVGAVGCGSLSSVTRNEKLKQAVENDPNYSIAGVQGPVERSMSKSSWKKKRADLLKNGDEETSRVLSSFDEAQADFDAEKYAEAERKFSQIVQERRSKYESFGAKFRRAWGGGDIKTDGIYSSYGDPIEEDAIFMMAESQYAQRLYPKAEESYKELLARYPSTRYLDQTTRQLFRIARYWLDFPEEIGADGDAEVKTASHEEAELGKIEEPTEKPPTSSRVPVLPNLTDPTRPLFDTHGRGKQALRTIWLNDATGPLADDALMLAANHSLRTEDYVEAARLYKLLREQYPDSPHLKDAYLLGSHVTLASYQGPAYDGKSLEVSRELKQEMLAIFPDLTEDQQKQLQNEVDRLKDAEVARLWDLVEFYEVKRMNPAVKLHCYHIINNYPDSKYAEMSRQALARVEERERAWANSIWNFNRKPQPPQAAAEPPSQQSRPQQSPPANVALPDSKSQPSPPQEMPQPDKKPSFLQRMNPLRRSEQPPQLERIEETKPRQPRSASEQPGRATL